MASRSPRVPATSGPPNAVGVGAPLDTRCSCTAGVRFFFLPPYSPEMNAIEPLWRQVKYQDLLERSHKVAASLQAAVDEALTNRADRLSKTQRRPESDTNLRRCA